MDAKTARVEMARRYEDVAAGMQIAQRLARMVSAHVLEWLSGLPGGIAEWLAGLRLGRGRASGWRLPLDAHRA